MKKILHLFLLLLFSNTLSAQQSALTDSAVINRHINTPYGYAKQSAAKEALTIRSEILKGGKKLYRLGTNGKSAPPNVAQFWSAEDPRTDSADYARKYGIPLENVIHADYIVEGFVKDTTQFITRESPPAPGQTTSTGGIEVVVPPGGVTVVNTTNLKKKDQ